MKTLKTIVCLSFLLVLFGCTSSSLQGTYVGTDGAFFDKLTFTSNDTVELVFAGGTSEVSYTLEDGKVKISNAGQNQILKINDDGCLDGGGFIGKYCKE